FLCFSLIRHPPYSTLFPYTTLFRSLHEHVEYALHLFRSYASEISGVMRKHQLKLADRQCRMAELSQRVQDTVTILVTALWGAQRSEEHTSELQSRFDLVCRLLLEKK